MEARHVPEMRNRLLMATRKQNRSFLNGPTGQGGRWRNSLEFNSFLGSMLGLDEAGEARDWPSDRRGADWCVHSSLPDLTLSPARPPQSGEPRTAGCPCSLSVLSLLAQRAPVRAESSSMVRGQTQRRTSSASREAVVRPAMRLPRDLMEKMPSAPTSPLAPRKDHVASKLASDNTVTKKTPKTVASMVRR